MIFLDSIIETLDMASGNGDPMARYLRDYYYDLDDPMGDYIGFKDGQVTYIPTAKIDAIAEKGGVLMSDDTKGRVGIKPAKWARRVLEHMKPSLGYSWRFPQTGANDYERFAHVIRAESIPVELRIVTGEDIRFWYHEDNTAPGCLDDSCMRYWQHQPYMDLYVYNSCVRLLIAVKDEKLVGRALLWTCTDGQVYMDRAYGEESIVAAMRAFARKQGFERIYLEWEQREKLSKFFIQLDVWDFDFWPTLDTLYKMDWEKGLVEYEPIYNWGGRNRPGPGRVSRSKYPRLNQPMPETAQTVVLGDKVYEYQNRALPRPR